MVFTHSWHAWCPVLRTLFKVLCFSRGQRGQCDLYCSYGQIQYDIVAANDIYFGLFFAPVGFVHVVKHRIGWGSFVGPHFLSSQSHPVHTRCYLFLKWKSRFDIYDPRPCSPLFTGVNSHIVEEINLWLLLAGNPCSVWDELRLSAHTISFCLSFGCLLCPIRFSRRPVISIAFGPAMFHLATRVWVFKQNNYCTGAWPLTCA